MLLKTLLIFNFILPISDHVHALIKSNAMPEALANFWELFNMIQIVLGKICRLNVNLFSSSEMYLDTDLFRPTNYFGIHQ